MVAVVGLSREDREVELSPGVLFDGLYFDGLSCSREDSVLFYVT